MQMQKDASFYAVIAAHRPDLLDYDDIRMLGKALLDEIPIRKPTDRLPKKVRLSELVDSGQINLNGNGAHKRRRRSKRAKRSARSARSRRAEAIIA